MLTQPTVLTGSHNLLTVQIDNNILLEHVCRAGGRPYIHPLQLPGSSLCLTQDSPKHHPWQHGIYTGYHGVNGSDFWLEQGASVGRIESAKPEVLSDESWRVSSCWRHHQGHVLFQEQQEWSVKQEPGLLVLDLAWSLTAAVPISIEQSKYGGLFLRMPFNDECDARVINNHGQEDNACEQEPATWLALDMLIEGERAGICIIDHPSNADGETRWRVDNQRGINPSPCIEGPIIFNQDQQRVWRYRLLAYAGSSAPAVIESMYKHYIQEN